MTKAVTLAGLGSTNPNLTAPIVDSLNGGQLAGMRNRIINGGMQVAQRGSVTVSAADMYTLDRWAVYSAGSVIVSQGISALGEYAYNHYLQIEGNSASAPQNIRQRIEAVNCMDMAGNTVTLTYWFYQTTGTTQSINPQLAYATTSIDNWAASTLIAASPVNFSVPSGSWTKVSSQFVVPSGAVYGLQVNLNAASIALSTGQLMRFANVQLEIGSVATPFEQRPYGMELALCQRYLEVLGTNPRWNIGMATANSTTGLNGIAYYKVTKRTPAVGVTFSNAAGFRTIPGGVPCTLSQADQNDYSFSFAATGTGYAVCQAYLIQSLDAGDGKIYISAEL